MEIIINDTQTGIKKAAKALKDGHLVAFPTETVYGLGADATNEKAVSRIYSVKGRPNDHPLIVHISSINQLDKWAIETPQYAIKLAENLWPGPMTLILKRGAIGKDFITGGQDNIGLRVPAHPIALALLTKFNEAGGFGIAAPSANRFGAVSPTSAAAVEEELGKYLGPKDLVLDGDRCQIGIESTIIDCTKSIPKVLRPGGITLEMIKEVTSLKLIFKNDKNDVKTSGLLDSHYSPKAKVVIGTVTEPGDGLIALKNCPTPPNVVRLASPANVTEYAMILYESLRMGDQKALKRIVVIPPDGDGIAIAIRDRLLKAAFG